MSIFRRHTMLPNKINKTYTIIGTVVNGWDNTSLPQTSVFVGDLEIEITDDGDFSYQLTTSLSILKSLSIFITCEDLDGLQYEKELFFDENLLSGTIYNLGEIVLTSNDLVSVTTKLIINGFTLHYYTHSGLNYEDPLPNCDVKLYIGGKLKAKTTSNRNGQFTLIVDKALVALPDNSYITSTFNGNVSDYPGVVQPNAIRFKNDWNDPDKSVSGQLTHNNVRLTH